MNLNCNSSARSIDGAGRDYACDFMLMKHGVQ